MAAMPEGEEGVFGGQMPSGEGQRVLEMHGMAPIPLDNRYGRLHRIFTVWFTPNLVPSAFFIGTLATASYIGLGFWLGARNDTVWLEGYDAGISARTTHLSLIHI